MRRIDDFSVPWSEQQEARERLKLLGCFVAMVVAGWLLGWAWDPDFSRTPWFLKVCVSMIYGAGASLALVALSAGSYGLFLTFKTAFGRPEKLLPAPRHITQQSLAEWRAYLRADETDIIDSDEGKQ